MWQNGTKALTLVLEKKYCFLNFISALCGCVSIVTYSSLVGICGYYKFSSGIKNFRFNCRSKKLSVNCQEKEKKHNIVLLEKTKLNTIEIHILEACSLLTLIKLFQ